MFVWASAAAASCMYVLSMIYDCFLDERTFILFIFIYVAL